MPQTDLHSCGKNQVWRDRTSEWKRVSLVANLYLDDSFFYSFYTMTSLTSNRCNHLLCPGPQTSRRPPSEGSGSRRDQDHHHRNRPGHRDEGRHRRHRGGVSLWSVSLFHSVTYLFKSSCETVKHLNLSFLSLSFGKEITCKTGKYRGQKVPSDLLPVQVKYGKNTTKDVTAAYQYSENPKITDYNPKASFLWWAWLPTLCTAWKRLK